MDEDDTAHNSRVQEKTARTIESDQRTGRVVENVQRFGIELEDDRVGPLSSVTFSLPYKKEPASQINGIPAARPTWKTRPTGIITLDPKRLNADAWSCNILLLSWMSVSFGSHVQTHVSCRGTRQGDERD
jgi:hypothetical protein